MYLPNNPRRFSCRTIGKPTQYVLIKFGALVHETNKAYKLLVQGKKVWVPKVWCTLDLENKLVTMPDWLAAEKDLV